VRVLLCCGVISCLSAFCPRSEHSGAFRVRNIQMYRSNNLIDMNLTLKTSMACVLPLGEYDLNTDILTMHTVLDM
jgi:hypothetical protein